jgi:hypothetical protein
MTPKAPTSNDNLMLAIAHDHQLRALLKEHLRSRTEPGDLVVDELLLAWGDVRADVARVNGHLEGFEIKAGRDTLQRLPSQVRAYEAVFDFSWLVTTQEHLKGVREIVPASWGLMVAKGAAEGVDLKVVRSAKPNRRQDPAHLVRLLWREEVMAKLEELGASRGLKRKPKIQLFAALAAAMPVPELSAYVRECLKARQGWRAGR